MRWTALILSGAVIVLVAGCGSGKPATPTISPLASADAYPVVAALAGHLTGTWHNSTFSTTGTMTWDVTADVAARTVTITVRVRGGALGGSDPPPETIKLDHLGTGQVSGASAAFGTVNGTISTAGAMHMTMSFLPNQALQYIEMHGTISGGTTVSMTYDVHLAMGGGVASGTVSLVKE